LAHFIHKWIALLFVIITPESLVGKQFIWSCRLSILYWIALVTSSPFLPPSFWFNCSEPHCLRISQCEDRFRRVPPIGRQNIAYRAISVKCPQTYIDRYRSYICILIALLWRRQSLKRSLGWWERQLCASENVLYAYRAISYPSPSCVVFCI